MKKNNLKKTRKNAEKLAEEILNDPLVKEYFEKQKKLFKITLNKAIKNAKKNIDKM